VIQLQGSVAAGGVMRFDKSLNGPPAKPQTRREEPHARSRFVFELFDSLRHVTSRCTSAWRQSRARPQFRHT
jgi:hypothetical protein